MKRRIRIRRAEIRDVDAIASLLTPFAQRQIILPRSRDDIYQHLQEFLVADIEEAPVASAALHIYAANLAEIRSLVVAEEHQGMGIGRILVRACERWGKELGVTGVFALTYAPEFFVRLGYTVTPKESLPHKIWTACIHCGKFADCDETAVRKSLVPSQMLGRKSKRTRSG